MVIDTGQPNNPIDRAAQRSIAAVPGVRRAATVGLLQGVAQSQALIEVIVVDPARYAALVAGTPQPAFPHASLGGGRSGGPVPLLVSRGARQLIGSGTLLIGYQTVRFRAVGRVGAMPGSGATGAYVVTSQAAIARAVGTTTAEPSRMLLTGSAIDVGRLRALVHKLLPGATVTFRSKRLAALADALLPHGTYVAYAQGAAAAALFGVIVLLVMLALGARSRELTLARLFTMGLTPAQARRLLFAEALPLLAGVVIGGAACALLLVPLLGPSLDLSPLTGSTAPVPVRADYAVLAVVAGGLLVLALITLIAQSAATRLRGLARGLRVGE